MATWNDIARIVDGLPLSAEQSPHDWRVAQARRRAVNAPHLVAPVRAGTHFHKGKLLERSHPPIHRQPKLQPRARRSLENRRKLLACGPPERCV